MVDVSVDKVSMFSRALFASSEVEASPSTVWNCLTDYDKLGDFIPSLAVNRCLEVGTYVTLRCRDVTWIKL